MNNYRQAHERWATAKLFRGGKDEHDERKLVDDSRPRLRTVRKLRDGSIAFKFHSTDVVVWHPDDSITLTSLASRTTNDFVCGLTPFYVSFPYVYVSAPGKMVTRYNRTRHARKLYRIRTATFVHDGSEWVPTDDTRLRPFTDVRVDRIKSVQALAATNYHKFTAVAHAIHALTDGETQKLRPFRSYTGETHLSDERLVELLAKEQYRDIVDSYGSVSRAIEKVREAVYCQARCFTSTERQWIWENEYSTLVNNRRKYGRYV